MQRPDVGSLLKGLRTGLAETVLPDLPDGTAKRQLRAALHLIGRLERTWDLAHAHLAADNADIRAFFDQAGVAVGATPPDLSKAGYNDPALAQAAADNLMLHGELAALDPAIKRDFADGLQALYRRMAQRDSVLVGDSAPDPAGTPRDTRQDQ